MALFDCVINEKCCSVDGGRDICPLFSSPPRGFDSFDRGMLGAGGIDWCISLKSFEGSVLESLASSDTSDIEIGKLELELELRKFDAQKEWELRELEFKERELREREKEREARIEKQRLDHELEMKKLEMQEKLGCSHPISSSGVKFDVSKYIK